MHWRVPVSKKANRIKPHNFIYEDELCSLEQSASVRETAISFLGELDATKRQQADECLCEAIYTFVLDAIEEDGPPSSEIRDRLRKIAKCAKELDELMTGGKGHPAEPLPDIGYALIAPSGRNTGDDSLEGAADDGVIYVDDAPVIAAIEAVRAIERWVSTSLPMYEQDVKTTKGGPQSGRSKSKFLSSLGDIFVGAKDEPPTLTRGTGIYHDDDGEPLGVFAEFATEALRALRESLKPEFDRAAPTISASIVKLADSPVALCSALGRDVEVLKFARKLKR